MRCCRALLCLTTVLLPGVVPAAVAADLKPSPAHAAEGWYAPRPADFEGRYRADTANQKRQDWNHYWYWVTVFYDPSNCSIFKGLCKPGVKGWTADAKTLLACAADDPTTREELRRLINNVGYYIATEWSKDNYVRRISSRDLERWGERVQASCDGGAAAALGVMLWLRDQVAQRLPEAVEP